MPHPSMLRSILSRRSNGTQRASAVLTHHYLLRHSIGQQRHLAFTVTHPLFEQRKIKVPTMGDSITEGTIVEWTAQVGQAVKADDVVALVETDKVTVEIKAEMDGVITQQFGAVDDTVEVGADLYEIDTEAEATMQASSSEASAKVESLSATSAGTTEVASLPPVDITNVASASSTTSLNHRIPSIRFLGKEGWAAVKSGQSPNGASAATAAATSGDSRGTTVIVTSIPPSFGRPAFSEEEMEALILGGANIAPQVVSQSGGAKFK